MLSVTDGLAVPSVQLSFSVMLGGTSLPFSGAGATRVMTTPNAKGTGDTSEGEVCNTRVGSGTGETTSSEDEPRNTRAGSMTGETAWGDEQGGADRRRRGMVSEETSERGEFNNQTASTSRNTRGGRDLKSFNRDRGRYTFNTRSRWKRTYLDFHLV
jgi:hypothetical protein